MTDAGRWDAAARRTLRGAQAVLASGDVRWFDDLVARQRSDAWAAFDRLIHSALAAGAGTPAAQQPGADGAAAALPRVQPLAPLQAAGGGALAMAMAMVPAGAGGYVPAGLSRPAAEAAVPHRPARAAAPARWGRAARVARLAAPPGERTANASAAMPFALPALPVHARPSALAGALAGALAPPMSSRRAPAQPVAAAPTPSSSARIVPLREGRASHAVSTVPSAAAAPQLPLSVAQGTAALLPSHASASNSLDHMQGDRHVTAPAPPHSRSGTTRLVDGLPALHGLLQAAVAHSQQRQHGEPLPAHAGSPAAVLPPPAPPQRQAAAVLRALPQLDALAEDMLVDRLADRLQERLREQALRHFGFTGGLV